MMKVVFLTALMAVSLVCNKKMFMKDGSHSIGYWMVSFLGIMGCAMTLINVNTSLCIYLNQFVKALYTIIFGGSV